MARLVSMTLRIDARREAQLRKDLGLEPNQTLTHIMIYYAIRDTVCAWLDGGQESDLSGIKDMDEDADGMGMHRTHKVSEHPYKTKQTLKIRRKKRQN